MTEKNFYEHIYISNVWQERKRKKTKVASINYRQKDQLRWPHTNAAMKTLLVDSPRPETGQSWLTDASFGSRSCGGVPRFVHPQNRSCLRRGRVWTSSSSSFHSFSPAVYADIATRDLLNDVVDGLADDVLHHLRVLLGHPLQPDAKGCLFGAAVISKQQDITSRRQTVRYDAMKLPELHQLHSFHVHTGAVPQNAQLKSHQQSVRLYFIVHSLLLLQFKEMDTL